MNQQPQPQPQPQPQRQQLQQEEQQQLILRLESLGILPQVPEANFAELGAGGFGAVVLGQIQGI